MRQWMIELVGPERWDQVLAVLASVLIVIVPLTMLFFGMGLWHKLPWTDGRDEAEAPSAAGTSDDEAGERPD